MAGGGCELGFENFWWSTIRLWCKRKGSVSTIQVRIRRLSEGADNDENAGFFVESFAD